MNNIFGLNQSSLPDIPRRIDLSGGLSVYIEVMPVQRNARDEFSRFTPYVFTQAPESEHLTTFFFTDAHSSTPWMVPAGTTAKWKNTIPGIHEKALNDSFAHDAYLPQTQRDDQSSASIKLELDQQACRFRYSLVGRPCFFLIRNGMVGELKDWVASQDNGRNQAGDLFSNQFPLKPKDKFLYITGVPYQNGTNGLTIYELKEWMRSTVKSEPTASISDVLEIIRSFMMKNGGFSSHENSIEALLGMEIENKNEFQEVVWKPHDVSEITELVTGLSSQLEKQWEARGFESPQMRLRPVLEEAVLNAWLHGNKQDPSKAITVRWRYGNESMLEVVDEGDGFRVDSVPDPTLSENICKPNGRGIFIMRYVSDDLHWDDDGRRVMAYFKKHPDTQR